MLHPPDSDARGEANSQGNFVPRFYTEAPVEVLHPSYTGARREANTQGSRSKHLVTGRQKLNEIPEFLTNG